MTSDKKMILVQSGPKVVPTTINFEINSQEDDEKERENLKKCGEERGGGSMSTLVLMNRL